MDHITFIDFQMAALRTADPTRENRLAVAVLGLAGEAGECANVIKKAMERREDTNLPRLVDELGDVLWYVAEVCSAFNLDMGRIAEHNIDKLQRRYPSGHFTAEESRAQADKAAPE